jgi:ribosomal protein S18 acetylase RimI-like enzyme
MLMARGDSLEKDSAFKFKIRPLYRDDGAWVMALIEKEWGSPEIVSRGKIHHADELCGFAAVSNNKPVGLATYRIDGNECEIVSLNSLQERRGIASALVEAVKKVALGHDCRHLWVVTTNDNVGALRFYQKIGFRLVEIRRDAIEQSRRLKPEIPLTDKSGIPLKDEIELELILNR